MEMNPRFPFVTPGVWELPLIPSATEVAWFSVCGVFVDDLVNGTWFLFYWGLMLLWVMGVEFDNTCAVSGKWYVLRVIPRLYGWVYKTLKLSSLVVEHSVVVMSARLNPMVEDSDTGGSSSIIVRVEYVFAFQNRYCELCVENQWGGGRKHCLVNFCFLPVLESSVDEGWWSRATWNRIFF